MESYLLTHPWLVATLWVVLYVSDYYLTIWGTKLHKRQDVSEVEGSYELNPGCQDDIDKERMISWKFVLWLVWGGALLVCVGSISAPIVNYYGLLVGYLLIPELVVQIRHVQNISHYMMLLGPNPGTTGHLVISRRSIYTRSATSDLLFGLLMLALFAFALSPVLLGGAVALVLSAARHRRYAHTFPSKMTTGSLDDETAEQPKAEIADS